MSEMETLKAVLRGPQVWPLGVKAYHALGELGLIPEKTELLYGQIYHQMPKSRFRTLLLLRLLRLLQQVLLTGCHVRPEQPLTCADSEPNLAVVHGSEEGFGHAHPRTVELVIKICVGSHEYDRSKLRAYASAGVKECWLVLGPEKQIEVHRQPQGEQFAEHALHGPGGSLISAAVPGFTDELDHLFAA